MNQICDTKDPMLPELLGRVFEEAPVVQRGLIVEHLLKPLGLLAFVGVSGGIFAKLAWKDGTLSFKIPIEQIPSIETHHIVALAQRVQMVSTSTLESLAQVILQSPALASTAAAAMLISALHNRANNPASTLQQTSLESQED